LKYNIFMRFLLFSSEKAHIFVVPIGMSIALWKITSPKYNKIIVYARFLSYILCHLM